MPDTQKRLFPRLFALLACSAALTSCAEEGARQLYPAPTEHVLDDEAEGRQKSLRKAWFEHRHQAGPGVDWRELERANGEAQIAKRNRLGLNVSPHQDGADPRWIERGSQNVAGRVHAAFPAADGQSLYLGSALGGTWQGNLDGTGWAPFGDNLYGGAHHLVAVSGATPSDPDVVLASTDGGNLHVTRDHGVTWEIPFGLGQLQNVRRVLVTSDGSETVFVVRQRSSGYRLVRSTDRMANFFEVYNLGSFAGDAWIRRDGSNDLYLMTNTGVVKSTDLGDTWVPVGPKPATGNSAELVGSEAGAPRLWSTMGSSLYRSDNAGVSWSSIGGLSDYWTVMNASITNADIFLYGGVEAHKTTNGGTSFAVINTWGAYYGNPAARLHADIQGIDVFTSTGPTGEIWYISTDGGLYRSTNSLATVQNLSLSGLRVSQYYSTHTSSADSDHVLAGSQDQGYQRASLPPVGSTNLSFNQLISGDYGHLTSGDGDHGAVFSTYPGFILAQLGETNPALYQVSFPPGEDNAWMPPVVADPLNANHFFFCASHLYRYTKSGASSWTRTQWSSFDFGVSGGEYMSALIFSPLDVMRAWAVTDWGRLYRSTDRGQTWTSSGAGGPGGQYFYGTAMVASRTNVNTVFVGGSGYSGPAVYRSTDGGVTYQPWSDGLPPTLVYCLGEARDGSGQMFAGTETAAYARRPTDAAWIDITGTSAPITIYWSVEALPQGNTMRFGTYGRGIWDYRLGEPAIAQSRNGSGVNPICLTSVTPPILGSVWSVSVDPSLVPGALRTRLIVREQPTNGTLLARGELLATGARYLVASQPADPDGNVFTFPIPSDPGLVGLTATAQALLVGAETKYCNALDLVLGYE